MSRTIRERLKQMLLCVSCPRNYYRGVRYGVLTCQEHAFVMRLSTKMSLAFTAVLLIGGTTFVLSTPQLAALFKQELDPKYQKKLASDVDDAWLVVEKSPSAENCKKYFKARDRMRDYQDPYHTMSFEGGFLC